MTESNSTEDRIDLEAVLSSVAVAHDSIAQWEELSTALLSEIHGDVQSIVTGAVGSLQRALVKRGSGESAAAQGAFGSVAIVLAHESFSSLLILANRVRGSEKLRQTTESCFVSTGATLLSSQLRLRDLWCAAAVGEPVVRPAADVWKLALGAVRAVRDAGTTFFLTEPLAASGSVRSGADAEVFEAALSRIPKILAYAPASCALDSTEAIVQGLGLSQ